MIRKKYKIKIKSSLQGFGEIIKPVFKKSEFYYAFGYSLVFFGIIICNFAFNFASIIHYSLKEIEVYQQFKTIIQSNITENNFIHYFFIILAVLFIISVVGSNIGSYRARLKTVQL